MGDPQQGPEWQDMVQEMREQIAQNKHDREEREETEQALRQVESKRELAKHRKNNSLRETARMRMKNAKTKASREKAAKQYHKLQKWCSKHVEELQRRRRLARQVNALLRKDVNKLKHEEDLDAELATVWKRPSGRTARERRSAQIRLEEKLRQEMAEQRAKYGFLEGKAEESKEAKKKRKHEAKLRNDAPTKEDREQKMHGFRYFPAGEPAADTTMSFDDVVDSFGHDMLGVNASFHREQSTEDKENADQARGTGIVAFVAEKIGQWMFR